MGKASYISARNVQSLVDDPESKEEVIAKQILRLDGHHKKLNEAFSLLQMWLASDPPIFMDDDMCEFGEVLYAYCMSSIGEHAVFDEILSKLKASFNFL